MINKNLLRNLSFIYLNLKSYISKIYHNSKLYDKKISKICNNNFEYKPSPHLLSSIVKYQKKKYLIENFALESVWQDNISLSDFKKLNNFFWFFSLDLKSSKKDVQFLISNWIKKNNHYNDKSWDFDLTSKRIISWLSNYRLTYEGSENQYKIKFD